MNTDDYECTGCGMTGKELKQQNWTDDDIEENSIVTNAGNWYCHDDCYRDSGACEYDFH